MVDEVDRLSDKDVLGQMKFVFVSIDISTSK